MVVPAKAGTPFGKLERLKPDPRLRGDDVRYSLMKTQRGLDVAHHGDQARPEIVFELALLHHESGDDAVERHDLAVHRAAHRRAHGVDLAAQLAGARAEAARADVVERLV